MDWVLSLWKIRRDFAAPTFALIAQVHPILHRVSCSYETIPNAPKHYETHQNLSLGSNGVDQVRSLQKVQTWHRGTNFCINCTCTVCFATSFMQLRNDPKYYKTHRKNSIGSNGVDWLCLLRKIPTWLCVTNFFDNCTSSVCFASGFMQLRNDPKCTEILWNRPKH